MYLMFKWTRKTKATWKWEICKWKKYGSCQRKRRRNFFSQLFPVIELRSSSLCADVMIEAIRREIRRCLKLCKLYNPEFFTPCFVPHFVVEYFGNILFKFAVASFDVRAINKVISWFILMKSSFFDSSRPLMAGIVNPSFVVIRQKACQLNGDRNIKKFLNAMTIHHDLGRFWDVFNIDWWKFVQFSSLLRKQHPSRCEWGRRRQDGKNCGRNSMRLPSKDEANFLPCEFGWKDIRLLSTCEFSFHSGKFAFRVLLLKCGKNGFRFHENDIHFDRMLLRRIWITLENKQSEESALKFICSGFGSQITTVWIRIY